MYSDNQTNIKNLNWWYELICILMFKIVLKYIILYYYSNFLSFHYDFIHSYSWSSPLFPVYYEQNEDA